MRSLPLKTSNSGDTLSADDFNAQNEEGENAVTSSGQALDPAIGPDTDLNMLAKSAAIYSSCARVYTDTGAANAYVLELTGSLEYIEDYFNGMTVYFKIGNTNTGASTVTVNSLAVKSITDKNGNSLVPDSLLADTYAILSFNETDDRFELVKGNSFGSPTGTMIHLAFNADSNGYLLCDGSAVSRTVYSDLFAAIGTTYGVGDGSTTFNLPRAISSLQSQAEYNSLTSPATAIRGLSVNSSNSDVWISTSSFPNGSIYKSAGGTASFIDQSAPNSSWNDVTVDASNNDVWICSNVLNQIYKNAGGVGSWVDQSAPVASWTGITVNVSNQDIWAIPESGTLIYKNAGGLGVWTSQTVPFESWRDISVDSFSGDVWACESGGLIYKNAGGLGVWATDTSAPSRGWISIAVNETTGDIFALDENADTIFKKITGTSNWIEIKEIPAIVGATNEVAVNSATADIMYCDNANVFLQKGVALYIKT